MKHEAEERVRILIVDDEKVMQESCARILLKSFGTEELTLAIRNAMKYHEGP